MFKPFANRIRSQDPRPTFSLLKFINYKAWGIFFLK